LVIGYAPVTDRNFRVGRPLPFGYPAWASRLFAFAGSYLK
jgi:hypothetical protein